MKRYGLVGFPLGHSFSAGYFAEKFRRSGLTQVCSYENFAVESIDRLAETLPADIKGFNITIPHKQNIIPLLSEIDPAAEAVGAVNCVKVLPGGRLKGYNTDIYGFKLSLLGMLRHHPVSRTETRALVLGTGGAAKAVHYVLSELKIPCLSVSRTCGPDNRLSYEQVTAELIGSHNLIVNTTPLGMFPHIDECPALPYRAIGPQHFLYDLVYNPAETLFLRHGRKQGAWVKNGLEMLILQAERSWEIWSTR